MLNFLCLLLYLNYKTKVMNFFKLYELISVKFPKETFSNLNFTIKLKN
jgi:hypothetical protein